MIRRYGCTAHNESGYGPFLAYARTASSWEAERVARIQSTDNAGPASRRIVGLFYVNAQGLGTTMQMYSVADVDTSILDDQKITILGYGSQGRAHALNLKDSGIKVVVG